MKTLVLNIFILAVFCGGAWAQPLDKLAGKLSAGLKDRPAIKLAVLEFPYTGGKASEGPVIVQERLTTALAQNKKITLIERGLLKKVLGELNLQASGSIDEETVKKLGKMLGADAIVTGTLNDIKETQTEINARIVETETAKILAAASLSVKKTWKDSVQTTVTPPVKPPQDFGTKPLVQVAVLLDTSNSMDGLINQARTQLWKIVNELVSAEKSGSKPAIEVALYEYGNSSLARETGWLRLVVPFTTDLDLVARELFALKTNGGDEYCGQVIKDAGTEVNILPKLASGQRPNVIDLMKNKDMALVINTPSGKNPREDEIKIRTAAMQNRIPIMTTLRGADAAMRAIKSLQGSEVEVRALQEYHS